MLSKDQLMESFDEGNGGRWFGIILLLILIALVAVYLMYPGASEWFNSLFS